MYDKLMAVDVHIENLGGLSLWNRYFSKIAHMW